MIADALRLSLVVSAASTAIVAVAGTLLGHALARGRFRGRELADAVLQLPLVLPPTVTGYYLLVVFGRRGPIGAPLHETVGWSIPFTTAACVLASAVVSLPLMVRAARVAFESVDPRQELTAASLGSGRLSVMLRVSLPLASRGLVAGGVLAFARGLGEFGATLVLAGNLPGRTQTLPLAIYEAVIQGQDRLALAMALALTAVSVVVVVVAMRTQGGAGDLRARG
jgi:molybdate transport system permease protein